MPPLRLGHRGARAARKIPENTLASFELCLQHGCDGFEFDVQLSADGEAVICHDATTGGLEIAGATAEKLALPTLHDVLRSFHARAFLDIELKVAGLEHATLEALHRYSPCRGYVVSSFLPEVIRKMYELDPAVPLGFLCEGRARLRTWREVPGEWVIPRLDLVDGEMIEMMHEAGKKVMVWTVNQPEAMRKCAAWEVDAIISDETEVLVRTLGAARD